MNIFVEISLLLAITTGITIIMRWLKQPLIVGYILSGIIVGPYVLNILHAKDEFDLFSKVGVVLLLFIVGLHLNPKVIKEVGKVSFLTGVGQVFFTSLIGFGVSSFLGLSKVAALYVAIALTFSSTIIILKLLSDKHDMQKFYAKISIGFLLVQDIIASLILLGVTMSGGGQYSDALTAVSTILFKGIAVLVSLICISTFVLPKLTKYLSSSQELLFLFSLTWGIGLGSLFLLLGFSMEIGALIAGVTLSSTPYAEEMASRMKPLRDFFIVIFFILLGSQMSLSNITAILFPALILSFFVLVGNPIIMIIIMNLLGYTRRTSFMAAMTVAQISEFSLILATLGLQLGHLSQETVSLITLVGLITITASSYLILYSDKLYPVLSHLVEKLEFIKHHTKEKHVEEDYTSLLFGYDRVGHNFVEVFKKLEQKFLVVDFNPLSIERLEKQQVPYVFGDASDIEFLSELPVGKIQLVISTVPDLATNILITHEVKKRNARCIVVVIAHQVEDAKTLYEAGASYVVMPHHLGAEYAAHMIKKYGLDSTLFKEEKDKHMAKLEEIYSKISLD